MSSQDNDGQQSVALTVVFGVVAVMVAAVLIAAVALQRGETSTPKTAVAAANIMQSTPSAQNSSAAATVKVKSGVGKF